MPVTLMYHAVMAAPEGCDEIERDLFVHPDHFEQQMEALAQAQFRSLRLESSRAAACRTRRSATGSRSISSPARPGLVTCTSRTRTGTAASSM